MSGKVPLATSIESLEERLKASKVKHQGIQDAIETLEKMSRQHWKYVLALEVELNRQKRALKGGLG